MSDSAFHIALPAEQTAGVFADFVRAWRTNDAFVLDFAALTQPLQRDEDSGEVMIDATVVSRVRIPPSQVFELMKALEQQLTAWENEHKNQPEE